MSQDLESKTDVDITLEEERKESEARSILQDLERLITIPQQRKRRWVWELLQNAKDCGIKDSTPEQKKITVTVILEKDKLTFSHDGTPFTLKNLLALVRRTSTKSYDNSDGNTGKFGTGFVTSHVLNRKVKVSGQLYTKHGGLTDFDILIDRTPTVLLKLQEELKVIFSVINGYYSKPPEIATAIQKTSYEYELDEDTYELARKSVEDFIKNLKFTLLINSPGIKTGIHLVNVVFEGETKSYSLAGPQNVYGEVKFSALQANSATDASIEGLLHFSKGNIVLAVPALKTDSGFKILKIENSSKLFKEFPLVGTEDWRIPFFVQCEDFNPSEPRDGIRTIKDNENKPDETADSNRRVLIKYREAAKSFFIDLKQCQISNLFLLTESGLPSEKTEYTSKEWYQDEVQKPLREFLLTQELLMTADGDSVKISESKIPYLFEDEETNTQFYEISVQYYHDKFPATDNFRDWQRIIHQDVALWGTEIVCTPEDLVIAVAEHGLENLKLAEDDTAIKWLNRLIGFLHKIGRADLGEVYPIYPNQHKELKTKQELRVDPGLMEAIKSVGHRLGLAVYSDLLHTDITANHGMDTYNVKNYYTTLNKTLGDLIPSEEDPEAFAAVLDLLAMFPDDLSESRNKYYVHIKQLIPDLVPEKRYVENMSEIFKDSISSRLAAFRYVSWLIERQETFETFTAHYFQGDNSASYLWLNSLFEMLSTRDPYWDLLQRYAAIPLQNGHFSKLDTMIKREDRDCHFDPILKQLYTSYSGKGDAKGKLIALPITCGKFPWYTANFIADPVDELFRKVDIEKLVMPEQPFNALFHELNDWFGNNETLGEDLFPHFSTARPDLYIKAFGPEVSKIIMKVHKLNRPIEEIEALANLEMNAHELGILVRASQMAGGTTRLMQAAVEIEQAMFDAEWRKIVGKAAEDAFKAAMIGSDFEITNPDRGYDFAIHYPEKESYFLEIKSTVESKETVKMSSLQGETARDHYSRYALCVIIRDEANTVVDAAYFKSKAKFIVGIGTLVKAKVDNMQNGLRLVGSYNEGDVKAKLDNDKYSVNVSRSAWKEFLNFEDFITHLRFKHFK